MVVPVLITSCQVSEYPNNGPVITHPTTTAQAAAKANGVPRRQEACRATSEKLQDCGCSGMTFISDPNNFYLRPRFRSQTAVLFASDTFLVVGAAKAFEKCRARICPVPTASI